MNKLDVKEIPIKVRIISIFFIWFIVFIMVGSSILYASLQITGYLKPRIVEDGVTIQSATNWPIFAIISLFFPLGYAIRVKRYITLYTSLLSDKTPKTKRYWQFKSMKSGYKLSRSIIGFLVRKYNFIEESKKNIWLFREEEASWIFTTMP